MLAGPRHFFGLRLRNYISSQSSEDPPRFRGMHRLRKCARACPSGLPVDQVEQIRSVECTACMACVAACPAQDAYSSHWHREKLQLRLKDGGTALFVRRPLPQFWRSSSSDWFSRRRYRDTGEPIFLVRFMRTRFAMRGRPVIRACKLRALMK